MDVGVVLMNSTTIKVTWAPVKKETVRGHLLGYKVLFLYFLWCLAHTALVLMNYTYIRLKASTSWLGKGFCRFKVMKNIEPSFIIHGVTL